MQVAESLPLEVVSADSRQVYRYLDVGTAKPSREERQRVPHYCVDIRNPDETYSAGEFAAEALRLIPEIWKRGKLPCVVGGSGFYIHALCYGLFEPPPVPMLAAIRRELQSRMEREGREALYAELQRVDPVSAVRYADRNPRRILRALEFFYAAGIPLSQAQQRYPPSERPFIASWIGIAWERERLYERINRRAEWMWHHGIVEETARVLEMGYSPEAPGLNTHGYRECVAYLRGELSAGEALVLIQRRTRQYAKQQWTWFRRYKHLYWIPGSSDPAVTADRLLGVLRDWLPKELLA
ncbi:MAG: tRNA (adenosine(37)-N6)-dimethylallyltransferase MiaA [Candidatus Kapabacteria bacterium]|nr:tRNA (adenosine(37)-N6)-dimethylallyltransferase MiaA [Candidatus Kapabacteria bacterium]MDW8225045.1 tRNA (adenosine(37)-N6)-dimethylallyltransferase MiaA [Bacteroidota bacterium]